MLISGYTFQNIYPQTGNFFFGVDLSVPTLTGSCSFGFSGDNGCFDFNFINGKIIYPNQQIVSYYNAGELINISGFVTPTSGLVGVRNKAFNVLKPTGGYNYFYVNPINCTADISVTIDGSIPSWTLDSSGCFKSGESILFAYNLITGEVPFRIFSGQVAFPSGFGISGIDPLVDIGTGSSFRVLTSGLTFQTTGDNAVYPLIMVFNTNYGNVTQNYTVFKYNGVETKFTVTPPGTGSGYILNKNSYQVFNVKALDISPSGFLDVPVSVNFNLISGSGQRPFNFYSVVHITGGYFVSGFIFGSGFVTGLYTGQVPGTGCITGNVPVSGVMSVAAYAGSGLYNVTGFAVGTGVAWGKNSTYSITGNLSTVQTVSGTYNQSGYADVIVSGAQFTGFWYTRTSQNGNSNFPGPAPNTVAYNQQSYFISNNSLAGRYFWTGLSGIGARVLDGSTTFKTGIYYRGFYVSYDGGDGLDTEYQDDRQGICAGFSGYRYVPDAVTKRIFYTGATTALTGVSNFSGLGALLNSVAQPTVSYSGEFVYAKVLYSATGVVSGSTFPLGVGGEYASGVTGSYYTGFPIYNTALSPSCLSGYRGTGFITVSTQSGITGSGGNLSQQISNRIWATSGTNTGWARFNFASGCNNNNVGGGTYISTDQPTFGCTDFNLQAYTIVSYGATGAAGTQKFYSGAVPKTWDLSGSNDLSSWTLIDSHSGVSTDYISFLSSTDTADRSHGPFWYVSNTGFYKYYHFNFYETQDAASTQLCVNALNILGIPRIYMDGTGGSLSSNGWVDSGIGIQNDGQTFVITGINFISGTSFTRNVTFTTVTGATGQVPIDSVDPTFGNLGIERYPGVPASGLISGSQSLLISGGRIFGPDIVTGIQTFYNRVWKTTIDTGMKFQPYGIVYYSGGRVIGSNGFSNADQYITGYTSGVPTSMVVTGNFNYYTFLTGALSGRVSGAFSFLDYSAGSATIHSGDHIAKGGYATATIVFSGISFSYVVPFTGVGINSATVIGRTGITFDYWDFGLSGLIVNPSGAKIVGTGTILNPILVFVSGYNSAFPGDPATSAAYGANRWPILTTGSGNYITGLGAYFAGQNIFHSGIYAYYGFFPTGNQFGTTQPRSYIFDSGRIQYTGTLDKPYYIGNHSGYSVDPSPMYLPATFFTGVYGYVESGFLYNTDDNLETRAYTGAYNYYPTGLHLNDFNSKYNYQFSVSGSQIFVRVPLYGIPTGPVSGVGGETLTGRYTGWDSWRFYMSPQNALTGTLGSGINAGYSPTTFYDTYMLQNFIGYSTNIVLINASGYVVAEFSGDIGVSGQGYIYNTFPNNWKVYTGALETIFSESIFFGTSGTSGQGVSLNGQGNYTPTSIYNGPSGNSIYGDYTDGFTMAVVYTGVCAAGYTAQLKISGLNVNSGYIINFSGKDV